MRRHEILFNAIQEVKELAIYLEGMADATHNKKLERAAEWMDKLSFQVCVQGYIGCLGGEKCSSDHK